MRLFIDYLKSKRWAIAAFLVFYAIFALCFILMSLPYGAIVYPAILCAAFGAVFLTLDFIHVRKKHRILMRMREMTAQLIDELPEPNRIEEGDYIAIIEELKEQTYRFIDQSEREQRDMREYYTLWTHQVKTPIASMRLMLQGEDTPLSNRLQTELFRIEQYVGMALAYVRLDQTSTDYVFSEHKLDDIIKRSVKKFAPEFIMKRLALNYTPTQLSVITDEKWLSFVIEQLLSNALKYTKEGGVSIYFEDGYTMCIEDTGIGISQDELPRIFEAGYTGSNGRADKSSSGLGLYLCSRVCKNLGAGLDVSSVVGEGTVVKINFKQYKLKRE